MRGGVIRLPTQSMSGTMVRNKRMSYIREKGLVGFLFKMSRPMNPCREGEEAMAPQRPPPHPNFPPPFDKNTNTYLASGRVVFGIPKRCKGVLLMLGRGVHSGGVIQRGHVVNRRSSI